MESREELLKVFANCGSACMPIDETLIIAEMSEDQWDSDKEAQLAYRRGQLKTKLSVRQTVAKMAREGVPQCIKIYCDFNKETTTEETQAINEQTKEETIDKDLETELGEI